MLILDCEQPDGAVLGPVYAYPERLTRPWTRVNFVLGADGTSAVNGLSGGLAHPADQAAYHLMRELADVVVVGAGTATAEGYRGVPWDGERVARRTAAGLAKIPPIAVVTGGSLAPDADVLVDTQVPSVVITCSAVGESRLADYRAAGAEVLLVGEQQVDYARMLAEFADRGWHRVLCEGGPKTFAALLEADLVDELCVTVSPLLAGGASGIVGSPLAVGRKLRLESAVHAGSAVLLRYLTERGVSRSSSERSR